MYRLLIADDELWSCEALTKIVRETAPDFRIEAVAHNGEEALRQLNEGPYDLVITDIRMPCKDGLELIREMDEAGMITPVIILSGYNEFEYAKTAIRYGAFDYLLKPINREDLTQVLERYRQHAARQSEELRKIKEAPATVKDWGSLPGPLIVKQVEQLIRTTYYEDHSLSALGARFNLNPAYLGRLFRAETGVGFVSCLTDIRMDRAKHMLAHTAMSVAAVSQHVGYWDDKHFIKIFKKTTGLTPSEYRSESRQ